MKPPENNAQVQQTAHWTAVIGAIALSICLTICVLAMAAVVVRDGNTTLVTNAMQGLIQLGGGFALVFGTVVGGPQVVSVLLGRFGSGLVAVSSPTDASPAAPPIASVTIAADTPKAGE